MSVDIVLVGGPKDGARFALPADSYVVAFGVLELAVAPVLTTDPPDEVLSPRTERYRWDGTVSDGARRFVREGPS